MTPLSLLAGRTVQGLALAPCPAEPRFLDKLAYISQVKSFIFQMNKMLWSSKEPSKPDTVCILIIFIEQ